MIKVLSFDLQGTLSESKFSDHYWLEILPQKYSQQYKIFIEEARNTLKEKFKEYGIYHILYYDDKYWSNYLKFDTRKELEQSNIRPKINIELYDFIQTIKLPKIIISTTTELFIEIELKEKINTFDKIYSCVDYFKTGGKTKEIYEKICKELKVKPSEILHIGDHKIMDIENAKQAGINTVLFDNDTQNVIEKIKEYMEGK